MIALDIEKELLEVANACASQRCTAQMEDWLDGKRAAQLAVARQDAIPRAEPALERQVAEWRKEVARLNDLIAFATGGEQAAHVNGQGGEDARDAALSAAREALETCREMADSNNDGISWKAAEEGIAAIDAAIAAKESKG